MIRRGLVLVTVSVALAATAAGAQTQSRVGADVSASAGYSSNPFTVTGPDTGAGLVTIDVAPFYQLLTPHSTITATADANLQQYFSKYGHNDSYSGALDYQGRPSQRLSTHARIDLSSAVLGAYSNYAPLASGLGTGTVGTTVDPGSVTTGTVPASGTTVTTTTPVTGALPQIPYTDVGLYGLRDRRRYGRVSGDLGYTLSPRDSLSASAYAEVTRYSGFAANDYDAFGGTLGYQRRLSSRLSLGIDGSVATYDYHSLYPDSRIYSIQATASATLSDRWSANGALGVSFIDGGGNGSTRSTSLSGNLALCRRGAHSGMCVQAARQATPTGVAGTQYVNTAGLSWNRELDQRQSIGLSANYSKVGGGQTLLTAGGLPLETEYIQANVSYSRRIGQRLRLTASANYRDLLSNYNGRTADISGLIGLAYRFGDRR